MLAEQRRRERVALAAGRQGTILTGGEGDTSQASVATQGLGAGAIDPTTGAAKPSRRLLG